MADEASLSDLRSIANLNLKDNFEEMVKDRIGWTRAKWIDSGETNIRFSKMISSIKYWAVKLEKAQGEKNVIVGAYHNERNVTLNLVDYMDEFDKIGVGHKIIGFTPFRNPRYVSFEFDTSETKKFVESNLKFVGDSNVIFLNWGLRETFTTVKVHWVTFDIKPESVIKLLSKYVHVEEWTREVQSLMDGRVLKNGTLAFKTKLKDKIDIKNIPHLINVEGLEFLVNVTGREIMCLNCNNLGHKSSECPTPYCSTCQKMREKKHICIPPVAAMATYARAVGGGKITKMNNMGDKTMGTFTTKNVITGVGVCSENLVKSIIKTGDNTHLMGKRQNVGLPVSENELKNKNVNKSNSRGWGDDENGLSEDEYLEDSSDADQEAVGKIKSYFDELQKLSKDSLHSLERVDNSILGATGVNFQAVGFQNMEVEGVNLKRKIEKSSETSNSSVVPRRGRSRRTYGRSGGGEKVNRNFTSENLFQTLVDEKGENFEDG